VNRYKTCEWCHKRRDLTTHHIKDRLGNKEEIIMNGYYIMLTMEICRPCHDEIERDYELTGKVTLEKSFMRENTLEGIEHNIYPRMSFLDQRKEHDIKYTTTWLEKKIGDVYRMGRRDRSCNVGLYNTKIKNQEKYSKLIMKLAIALNDMHTMKLYTR